MVPPAIAHYQIKSKLGEGGMGEVYRATDTKLGRDVAIKVIPEAFASDAGRMARFARESQVLAALNHPHIAAIYGVEESALVLELVEGPTLAERIAQGPMPVEEALSIARQIAEAVEYAHERGVIHRDLKPANIKLTAQGQVKVLDFGLAKLTEKDGEGGMASTQTMAIAGTPGYLAPEQLQGKPADARSDIFAFGCLLYELLSGRRAFPGNTLAASLAATAMAEPKAIEGAPRELERLVRRCLRKDPARRIQHMDDVLVALEDLKEDSEPSGVSGAVVQPRTSRLGWIAVALLGLAAVSVTILYLRQRFTELPVVRFAVGPPEKTVFTPVGGFPSNALVSPDGRRIAFGATSADGKAQVWVRALDVLTAQPLPGTDGGVPWFWSPDSHTIGFSADGKLKKIDAAGGSPITLADAPALIGGSWSTEGVVVFAPDFAAALMRVAAAGGAATPVTKLDAAHGESTHRLPWFLPDSRHFLFSAGGVGVDRKEVRIGSLDSLESKALLEADSNAIYAQGYLLFLRGATLTAQPFDAKRLALTGEAAPLAEQVQRGLATASGLFSASQTGLLAYRAGAESGLRLTWMDRRGKRLASVGDPADLGRMQLSPDQKSVAVAVTERNNADIWIYDLVRNLRTRFTSDPAVEREAIWSPDGRTIVFNSNRKGHFDLYRKASDQSLPDELLYADGLDKNPTSWSLDGKYLLYDACCDPKTGSDIWILPLVARAKPLALQPTPFVEAHAQFSPDGRWVAYQSNESGRYEINVLRFSPEGVALAGKTRVSTAGGILARWRRDGKELFFVAPDGSLMSAEVGVNGGTFKPGRVSALFRGLIGGRGYLYDVSADGQRFLAEVPVEQSTTAEPLTVVQNWTAGLKK
jgi:Tol biopolymer transport system component